MTTNHQRCDDAIDAMYRAGAAWHEPLISAVKFGLADLLIVKAPDSVLPLGKLRKTVKPTIILIPDDGFTSCGPSGWRCATQATAWAAAAMILASGPVASDYAEAVLATLQLRRVLIVDTASKHARAWATLLPSKPAMIRVPPAGQVHPVAETMH